LMRLAAHSVKADAPPDIITSAVMIPNWNKNATIKIVYQLIAPSSQTSRSTASHTDTIIVSGFKSAISSPATRIPAPSEGNTFLVVTTTTIATNGGTRVRIE